MAQLKKILERLRNKGPREPKMALARYLKAVYIAEESLSPGQRRDLLAICQKKSIEASTDTRRLIELTAPEQVTVKRRRQWERVLLYLRRIKTASKKFMKTLWKKGGVNKCASR